MRKKMCKKCAKTSAKTVQPGRPGAIQCAIKCATNVQSPGATWAGSQFQCAINVQCWVLINSVGRLIACGCENLISVV